MSKRVLPEEDLLLEEFDNISLDEGRSLRVSLIKAILGESLIIVITFMNILSCYSGQTPILTLLRVPEEVELEPSEAVSEHGGEEGGLEEHPPAKRQLEASFILVNVEINIILNKY